MHALIDENNPADEDTVRDLMTALKDTLDGHEGTGMEKALAAMHIAVAQAALIGCDAKHIRMGLEVILEANPAISMNSVIPAGRA